MTTKVVALVDLLTGGERIGTVVCTHSAQNPKRIATDTCAKRREKHLTERAPAGAMDMDAINAALEDNEDSVSPKSEAKVPPGRGGCLPWCNQFVGQWRSNRDCDSVSHRPRLYEPSLADLRGGRLQRLRPQQRLPARRHARIDQGMRIVLRTCGRT